MSNNMSETEKSLRNKLGANYPLRKPQSRIEKIYHKWLGEDIELDPVGSVEEALLIEIMNQGGGGGGGVKMDIFEWTGMDVTGPYITLPEHDTPPFFFGVFSTGSADPSPINETASYMFFDLKGLTGATGYYMDLSMTPYDHVALWNRYNWPRGMVQRVYYGTGSISEFYQPENGSIRPYTEGDGYFVNGKTYKVVVLYKPASS